MYKQDLALNNPYSYMIHDKIPTNPFEEQLFFHIKVYC